MIELSRYRRVKRDNLVWAELSGEGVNVKFKRFDVESGKELDPEVSYVSFAEMQAKLSEMENNMEVLKELLNLATPK